MSLANLRIQRGEPLIVSLAEDMGSDPSSALTQRRAVLKRAGAGPSVPDASVPAVAEFTITSRVASGSATGAVAAGFDLALSAAQTKALAPGVYVVNPAFGAGGSVLSIEQPLFILVSETTTDVVV